MDQYRTFGVLDKAALQEGGKYFVPLPAKCVFWFLGVWNAVSAYLLRNEPVYLVLYGTVSLFALASPELLKRFYIRKICSRIQENAVEGCYRQESYFTVDGLTLRNLTIGAELLFCFDALAQVSETEHYFFVMTRTRQFLPIFKECLTPEQQESFLPFLKEHCPKLKVRR